MAIKNKRIITEILRGGYSSESKVDHACYNNLGQCFFQQASFSNALLPTGFSIGIQLSNLSAIFDKLSTLIASGMTEAFQTLLETDFIIEKTGSVFETAMALPDGKAWEVARGTCVRARPNIEVLLINNIAKFEELIATLIKKNDPVLYRAFQAALVGTDMENANVFAWNDELRVKTLRELQNVVSYGELLTRDSRPFVRKKGELAINLGNELRKMVANQPMVVNLDLSRQFNNLLLKVQVIKQLHHQDATFDIHRGWKKIWTNLSSIFFTLGMSNFIKYQITGNALFFNNATAQANNINPKDAALPTFPLR